MSKKELTIDFDLYQRELRNEKCYGWNDGAKYIIDGLIKIIAQNRYDDKFVNDVFDYYDGIVQEDLRMIVAVLLAGHNTMRELVSKEMEEKNGK